MDLSGAFLAFHVTGEFAREFLSSGLTLDVWSPDFREGFATRTRFGPFDVALDMVRDDRCDLLVARSFARDMERWVRMRARTVFATSQGDQVR